MSQYVLSPSARADLAAIRSYLSPAPVRSQERVIAGLNEAFLCALRFPYMGMHEPKLSSRYEEQVRSFVVRPYRCFYLPERAPLEIFAILHGAQDIESVLLARPLP